MNINLYHIKYWPTWLGAGLLRLLTFLPHRICIILGRITGKLLYLFNSKRRTIASINIALCFPDLTESQRKNLVRQHFDSLGRSLFETAIAWWKSDRALAHRFSVSGKEHLDKALAQGKGVILLSAHFNSLELGLRFLVSFGGYKIYPVYQDHSNPVMENIISRSRRDHAADMISFKNTRAMIKHLKQGHIIWYAPDQGYRGSYSAIVPFFGIPAASNTATSRLAKISNAAVIPCFFQQMPGGNDYQVKLLPALENFPTDDPVADTLHYHQILEEDIRKAPEQYLWIHRRFKGRPSEYPDVYQNIRLHGR